MGAPRRLGPLFGCALALLPGAVRPGLATGHPVQRPLVLEGTIVTPETVIPNGEILIRGEKIEAVGRELAVPPDSVRVPTQGLVYPGLIDLHNHHAWNVFVPWEPSRTYNNRYEAWSSGEYRSTYARWKRGLRALHCERNKYGELKALVGGVTAIQGGLGSLGREACIKGLVRNLDYYSGLQGSGRLGEEKLGEIWDVHLLTSERAAGLRRRIATGEVTSLLVHLAEGRQGDPASGRELARLRSLGLLTAVTGLIHGTALTDADWEVIGRERVKLVWSPRSNLVLYGQTADVKAAQKHQVLIALAPDWSVTGSPNMLDELAVARRWMNDGDDEAFRSLVLMVTLNPARIAALEDKIGQVRAGHVADLLVIKGNPAAPYRSLVEAKVQDVQLVLIGGQPYYGSPDLMRTLGQASDSEEIDVCGARKSLHLAQPDAAQDPLSITWAELQARLTRAMSALEPPTKLAPLAHCR